MKKLLILITLAFIVSCSDNELVNVEPGVQLKQKSRPFLTLEELSELLDVDFIIQKKKSSKTEFENSVICDRARTFWTGGKGEGFEFKKQGDESRTIYRRTNTKTGVEEYFVKDFKEDHFGNNLDIKTGTSIYKIQPRNGGSGIQEALKMCEGIDRLKSEENDNDDDNGEVVLDEDDLIGKEKL